jgi:hypothetical protein
VGCRGSGRIHTRAAVEEGVYIRGLKKKKSCTFGKIHERLII